MVYTLLVLPSRIAAYAASPLPSHTETDKKEERQRKEGFAFNTKIPPCLLLFPLTHGIIFILGAIPTILHGEKDGGYNQRY